jgi:hypothetical protein
MTVRTYNRRKYSVTRLERVANELRNWLSDIARKRVDGYVTADDVHTYLNREGFTRNEVGVRLALTNSVLRNPDFRPVDEVPSERPAAKGRLITAWSRA